MIAFKHVGAVEKPVEFHEPVAVYARVRSFSGKITGNKTVDDLFPEIGGEVENEIRHSEVHCNRARILDVVKRTAGVLLRHSGILVIVQLHRASDAVVTLFGKERGADA